jgi:hypothetical protein
MCTIEVFAGQGESGRLIGCHAAIMGGLAKWVKGPPATWTFVLDGWRVTVIVSRLTQQRRGELTASGG